MSFSLATAFAGERLRKALAAAGLTDPAALVDLAVSAGEIKPESAGQIVHKMTVEDLGAELAAQLAEHTGSGEDAEQRRKDFFEGLIPVQQDALLIHLSQGGDKSLAQLACAFKVPLARLRQAVDDGILKRGEQVQSASMEHVVGALVAAADRAMQGLAAIGKWDSYWKVRKELTSKLEDLGIVRRTPKRLDVTVHAIDDLQQQELERILELERKKAQRGEELKRAQVSLIDVYPAITGAVSAANGSRDSGPAVRPAGESSDPYRTG